MIKKHISNEDKKSTASKTKVEPRTKDHVQPKNSEKAALANLQQQLGNRAVQRLIAQRQGEGSFEVEEETAEGINRQRGGGQPLDPGVQDQMGEAMGQDVIFREGAYQPHTGGGQELIAHELTHVVQQSTGAGMRRSQRGNRRRFVRT